MNIILGCEESQAVCIEMRKRGHNAFSCDLLPCSGGYPEWHIQGDVFEAIESRDWDMGIFFPTCTYLTCSAEWAYKDGPYHQKLKPGTLTGAARREARKEAIQFAKDLYNCHIPKVAIENPIGVLSSAFQKPDQIIQPWQFGDNASKSTCLWLKGLPLLKPTNPFPPRIVNGKKRWGNQTDSGQNKLTPGDGRAMLRSKTYPGIAAALASQYSEFMESGLSVDEWSLKITPLFG